MGFIDWLIDLHWGESDARLKDPGECAGSWSMCYSCRQVGKTKRGKVFAVKANIAYVQSFGKQFFPRWHCKDCLAAGAAREVAERYVGQIEAEKRAWIHAAHHGGK